MISKNDFNSIVQRLRSGVLSFFSWEERKWTSASILRINDDSLRRKSRRQKCDGDGGVFVSGTRSRDLSRSIRWVKGERKGEGDRGRKRERD